MFRFEHIEHLYALIGLPLLIAFFIFTWMIRKRALARFGNSQLIQQLMPQISKYKHHVKFVLLVLALGFMIVGWANPQWGSKREKVKRKSVDVFVALDISNSMLAQDVRPNRLKRAQSFAEKLIESLKGDRVGCIVFAGNAYLQMPLTTDYSAARLFTRSANPNIAPTQGTAIGEAISLAMESFPDNNDQHKALVIITDGENHEEEAIEMAKEAVEKGVLIFTVGVGTKTGGPIPVDVNGRSDFKRDKRGDIVKSALNETMMKDLASAARGDYFNLSDNGDGVIESLRARIDKIEKQEFEQRVFNEYESYFQYFIGFGLLLMMLEFSISYRQNKWLADKDFFK